VTYLVSVAGSYPFSERLLRFTVPSFHVVIAAGVEQVSRGLLRLGWLPAAALVGMLLYLSARQGVARGLVSRDFEEMRPVTRHVLDKLRPGDAVYVYYGAESPWLYYTQYFGAPETQFDLGLMSRDDPQAYLAEVSKYEGRPRAWFVFSHVYGAETGGGSEEALILGRLRCLGSEKDRFEAPGARAYLFDLTEPTPGCHTR
jgi:hypothetical protein